jgi:prepilin-type N-terminal cleavage/methylation domain-containing protein
MRTAEPTIRGFTLMELIVTVALVTVVLTLLTQVFNQTQQTISRGASQSEMMATNRAISGQLFEDAKRMNVPLDPIAAADAGQDAGRPGFLVIVQQVSPNDVRFAPTQQRNVPPSAWTDAAPIRTDQIAFFRSGEGVESLVPGSSNRFDSDARASWVRVWYGHLSPPGNTSINPGMPPMDIATNLILGRQAALVLNNINDVPPDGTWADSIFAEGPSHQSGDRIDLSNVTGAPGLGQLWNGATDAIGYNLAFAFDPDEDGFYADNSNITAPGPMGGQPNDAYKAAALSWAYALDDNRRLQGSPTLPVTGPNAFSVAALGQTHAVFAKHVSDFAIDFAADIEDQWGDDPSNPGTLVPIGTNGAVADGLPDGRPDTYDDGLGGRAIKWYSAFYNNPADGTNYGPTAPNYNPNNPITWPIPMNDRHSIADGDPYPPLYLIPPDNEVAFVFGHTGPDPQNPDTDIADDPHWGARKWWPYAIRIRYRLHNANGEFSSVDPATGQFVSGRWFEQIIPIPR